MKGIIHPIDSNEQFRDGSNLHTPCGQLLRSAHAIPLTDDLLEIIITPGRPWKEISTRNLCRHCYEALPTPDVRKFYLAAFVSGEDYERRFRNATGDL